MKRDRISVRINTLHRIYKLICISLCEVFDPQTKHDEVLGGESFVGKPSSKMFVDIRPIALEL